ncbi:MAG TPA: hypothetical protein PKA09_10065, partial [Geminicoccus sp.]|nr:hypothetical protein [Geminicoccus sp.]
GYHSKDPPRSFRWSQCTSSNVKSCIEDLFEKKVRETELEGQRFDPNRKAADKGTYGKAVFAEKVIRPAADSIDFSRFKHLLDRIVAVLDDYRTDPDS